MPRHLIEDLDDLARLLRSGREALLRAARLNPSRFLVLRTLADRPEISGGELARASGVRYQTMNETLDGLELAGLIERPGPVGPGYVRRAWLTRRGTVLVERCRAALTEIEHHMLQRFSAEQVDLFRQFLEECTLQLRRLPPPSRRSVPAPPRRR